MFILSCLNSCSVKLSLALLVYLFIRHRLLDRLCPDGRIQLQLASQHLWALVLHQALDAWERKVIRRPIHHRGLQGKVSLSLRNSRWCRKHRVGQVKPIWLNRTKKKSFKKLCNFQQFLFNSQGCWSQVSVLMFKLSIKGDATFLLNWA